MCRVTIKQKKGNRKRNFSLGSLCLGSICIGLTLGWPESSLSYFLLAYYDTKIYDPSSVHERATIRMIMNFGSCLGALVPSCIADTYGRRSSFAIAALSNFTFWVTLVSFRGYLEIIFSAAIGGFAAGVFVTTTALYVSEISLPHTRGMIGALSALCAYVGVLFGSCLIFITFFRIVALIMAFLAMAFLASLHWWMLESPYFLFAQGKTLEAKLLLKKLRGVSSVLEIDTEYKTIELYFRTSQSTDTTRQGGRNLCSLGSTSPRRRYTTFVIFFMCITQMIGAYGMNDYSKEFINVVLPKFGYIVISSFNVVSVAMYLCIIEKFGRRPLLLGITIIGSSVTCLSLAIFTLVDEATKNHHESHESSMIWPAIILILYYTIYSLGLTPVLPILTGDIYPSRYKTMALGLCISAIYLSSIMIQFTFDILSAKHGPHLTFAFFAIFGSIGMPFVFTFLPETRGKRLQEIHRELEDITIFLS